MNKQTEALKMAIKFIEAYIEQTEVYEPDASYVLMNCLEALEQPAQEPVAWLSTNSIANEVIKSCSAPSWQGLSDDEIQNILACNRGEFVAIKKAEQLLKDKNGR